MATQLYKQSTNTDPTKATLGEQSPAVLALQQSINKANAGVAGYKPLVEDAKYGPLTQAAFQKYGTTGTPAGGSTTGGTTGGSTDSKTTPPVDTTRYARTANPNDQAITDLTAKLGNTAGDAPDLAKITQQKRDNAQALVDSIKAEFAKTLYDQGVTNAGLNDRTRALNVTSGLAGSDFATSAAVGQEKKNATALDLIAKERDAKINEIYSNIDAQASTEYQNQRKDYIANLGNDLAARKAAREEDRNNALASIKGFASAGVDIPKLKTADPATYDFLLKQYGGSQLDLETAWNAALPDNMKVKYDQQIIQGKDGNAVVFRYGVDPRTGIVTKTNYDLGVPYATVKDVKPVEMDGQLWAISTDANGNQIAKPLNNPSALTQSIINKNNADAANNGHPSFKFSGTQRSKLISANFNDAKVNAIESDLKKYGVKAVLDGLSTPEEKTAVQDALKGSDLAQQVVELMKNGN